MLLAGLNTPGQTTVIEPVATRDHTERMLKHFGAGIRIEEIDGARAIHVTGEQELAAQRVRVPADPSSAAFAIVAALITQNSEITVPAVMMNATRRGLVDTLIEMGGDITIMDEQEARRANLLPT